MKQSIDDSWRFLADFYKKDSSIVELLNKALDAKSKVTLHADSFEILLGDVRSLLPGDNKNISYWNFFYAVALSAYPDLKDSKQEDSKLEEVFLSSLWLDILYSNSKANELFSKAIKDNSFISSDYVPYLILLSMGISADWFLYGGRSLKWFVNEDEQLPELKKRLAKGYDKWKKSQKSWKSKLPWYKKFPEQLYTFIMLLIVLRREWQTSQESTYISSKKKSLYNNIHPSLVYLSLIYGFYDQYDFADQQIRENYDKTIEPVKFHPLVAKRLLENNAYQALFIDDSKPGSRIDKFLDFEKHLDPSIKGKRLLINYYFPITKIRKDDIFYPNKNLDPNENLVDEIYLSLNIGSNYKERYREPAENELFDYIQIEFIKNNSGNYDYSYVNAYRNNLKPSGDFLIVRNEEDHLKDQFLKAAFSDFRHDLKGLMTDSDIAYLKLTLSESSRLFNALKELINYVESIMSERKISVGDAIFRKLRGVLKVMDNDDSFMKPDTKEIGGIIRKMRDRVEDYIYEPYAEFPVLLDEYLKQLRSSMLELNNMRLDECARITEYIEDSHKQLSSYILLAGQQPSADNFKDIIKLKDFLNRKVRHMAMLPKNFEITSDFSSLDDGCTIKFNEATLDIMLNSILDNALVHGFAGMTKGTAKVHMVTVDSKEFILLKICNNGKPIEISERSYKTRGVFSGITGHTGIGGYQISKYADLQGGRVEIPTKKEWNTEIHLYIKKNEVEKY